MDRFTWPTPGLYQHYKGGMYLVQENCGSLDASGPPTIELRPMITYTSTLTKERWTRPLHEFLEKKNWPDGTVGPAYARVSPATQAQKEDWKDFSNL